MIIILGALPIPKGAVPVLARGLGHTAPTYAVGSRIDKTRTACAARHTYKMDQTMVSVADQKSNLRTEALSKRDALSAETRIEWSLQASEYGHGVPLFDQNNFLPGTIVAGFHPIRSEIDPRPLMFELTKLGARLCLPVVTSKTTIEFRELIRGAELVSSGFGTVGPDENAAVLDPQILLVPLSVFDQSGGRIGYGAGFYDRAIEKLVAKGIQPNLLGMAFSIQQADHVPMESHDRHLDGTITENGYIPASS